MSYKVAQKIQTESLIRIADKNKTGKNMLTHGGCSKLKAFVLTEPREK